ncbi:Rax2p NDAI_0B02380 [Naumovozyma dairenensis CBS 421]|uniref:Bud site selection protein RAX2 n=1 Tax=Naumovozyma dairenensis (strain ATCC 10597 / BCRC 20456 / CBS 421 / NBRC 0211 / NRRL Y-12639) TaxID=1071378 RepID=G0W662_NAUDC|nr:hypothetical protein NDAI_0B02380 [Naumovozyma dairenensis CBS 421]CCD23273.1 hypothetical protein NDAI_0B02380 [Naumovozyma dairenensis CBS 421]
MLFSWVFNFLLLIHILQASQLSNIKNILNVTNVNIPTLNLTASNDDTFQLLGDIDGLSFYRYKGQQNFTTGIIPGSNSNGLIYYSNNTLIQLEEPSNDTYIAKITPFGSDSFILSGTGSLSGYSLTNQLLYNLTTLSIEPIFNTSIEEVKTILIDDSLVYFGGNFTVLNGTSNIHSLIMWDSTSSSTEFLNFGGFGENSIINSIVKLNDDNILFAGEFYTLDEPDFLIQNTTSSQNNIFNSTTVDIGQLVPLSASTWDTGESTFDSDTFVCPDTTEESWIQSGTTGSLTCKLPFEVAPTKIRIYNSPNEDNQVSLFRILTNEAQGIMNLTYIDPISHELKHCDAFCPLYSKAILSQAYANTTSPSDTIHLLADNTTDIKWTQEFQEFAFINQISVSSVQFVALDSYGNNVALSSFQLYQNAYAVFANDTLNEPNCNSIESSSSSSLSANDWEMGLTGQTYISTTYTPNQDPVPYVSFSPQIKYPGQYSINIYTPGCTQDDTCSSRAIVNVTVWDSDGTSILATELIYQNNKELKYDELYSGYLSSSPRVTIEYVSGLYASNTVATVVADRLNVLIDSLEVPGLTSNGTNNTEIMNLNGLLQYQISNFSTSSSETTDVKITNTSLNQLSLEQFSKNTSMYADLYDDNTLLLGNSNGGIKVVKLNENMDIESSNEASLTGNTAGFSSYSGGILAYGEYNLSSKITYLVNYNGTFNEIPNFNKNSSITNVVNLTIHDTELLVIDNQAIYNVSSSSTITNSSALQLSLWSSGSNLNRDTVFSGAIALLDYTDLNGSIAIGNNFTVTNITNNVSSTNSLYTGLFLNDSLSIYASKTDSYSELLFSNGYSAPWSFFEGINYMVYSSHQTMLAVASSDFNKNSELSILNLTTFETIANETLNVNSKINGLINFEHNSTLIVGGNFTILQSNCSGLCLYNYDSNEWLTFANHSINGTIAQMELINGTQLLLSGLFNAQNISSVNLAIMDLSTYAVSSIKMGDANILQSFATIGDKIITWNGIMLESYENGAWSTIQSNFNSSTTIRSIEPIGFGPTLQKRDGTGSADGFIINGNIYDTEYGTIQAMIYNFKEWRPYYIISSTNSQIAGQIFMNRDDSALYNSQSVLQNPNNATVTTPSSTSSGTPSATHSSQPHHQKQVGRKKIDRGFVVLIGLALALGTVSLLGIIGLVLAYIFKDGDGSHDALNPRTNEDEMLETVPPEKLMKFL